MKKLLPGLLLSFLVLGCSIHIQDVRRQEYVRDFEERFDISPVCQVSVSVRDGEIDIEGWDLSSIWIQGKIRVKAPSKEKAEEVFDSLSINRKDRKVNVRYKPSESTDSYTRMDCKISVPNRADLSLKFDDGVMNVSEIEGRIGIDGDDVELTMSKIKSDRLEIDNDDGSIEVRSFEGGIKIISDDTDVFLKEVKSHNISISTDDGDIDVETMVEKDGIYEFVTDDGDITLRIPENAALKVLADKDDGEFLSSLPIKGSINPRKVEGIIGSEGGKVYISTDDGDIEISKWKREKN